MTRGTPNPQPQINRQQTGHQQFSVCLFSPARDDYVSEIMNTNLTKQCMQCVQCKVCSAPTRRAGTPTDRSAFTKNMLSPTEDAWPVAITCSTTDWFHRQAAMSIANTYDRCSEGRITTTKKNPTACGLQDRRVINACTHAQARTSDGAMTSGWWSGLSVTRHRPQM